MRLKVIDVCFTDAEDWIYKLSDGISDFYVLIDHYYALYRLKNPISKHELDYLDVGLSVYCDYTEINNLKIITKISLGGNGSN
jgi:hypothetical protein